MKNAYDCADIIEIGEASTTILGWKEGPGLDSSCNPPLDRLYVEINWPEGT